MVMIPSEVGLNLRQPGDTTLQPVARVPGIPGDLPDLQAGQTFAARIQEVLPENTYRALVAGKSITLSLPESVKTGDMLELVVVDRTPRTILARLAEPPPQTATGAEPYQYATLSRAGQFIATLLVPEGESPPAAPLNRGEPLLAAPPRTGAELTQVLGRAVTESGLFYEAHQAQWVAGKLPLAALLAEPQGQHAPSSAPSSAPTAEARWVVAQPLSSFVDAGQGAPAPRPAPPGSGEAAAGRQQAAGVQVESQAGQSARPQIAAYEGIEAAVRPQEGSAGTPAAQAGPGPHGSTPASEASPHPSAAPVVPDQLRPLVQQQLDAAATQRLVWHGEVWPGQTMHWQIEREQADRRPGAEPEERWTTTLRLTTPRLGEVEAALHLSGGGVRISLATPSEAAAADLRAAAPALERALASAGVRLLGMSAKHESG